MAKKFLKLSNNVWNLIRIYEENEKVFVRTFFKTKNLTTTCILNNSKVENISDLLFPDKAQHLYGLPINVVYFNFFDAFVVDGKVYNKWTYFVEIVAQKLNGTLNFREIILNKETVEKYSESLENQTNELIESDKLDFFINGVYTNSRLHSYNYQEYCFMVPLPPKYSIFELVLILPLDKSCWMWLGISVAASFILWSVTEGSGIKWKFLFAMYAFFLGQNARIKT